MSAEELKPLLEQALQQRAALAASARSRGGHIEAAQAYQRLQCELRIARLAHGVTDTHARDAALVAAARWVRVLALVGCDIEGAHLEWRDAEGEWQVACGETPLGAPVALQGLSAAYLVGEPRALLALVRRGMFATLVDVARARQAVAGTEAFWAMLGEIVAKLALGQAPGEAELAACRSALAAGPASALDPVAIGHVLLPLFDVLQADARGDGAQWQAAFERAQTRHDRSYAAPAQAGLLLGLLALELSAAAKLARVRHGWLVAAPAAFIAADLAKDRAAPEPVPIELVCPLRRVRDARHAHWRLDLDGAPRGQRTHRLVERDGVLIAEYAVADDHGPDRWRAPFELRDGASALDAGELLAVSDLLASQVSTPLSRDSVERSAQKALLREAAAALDEVLRLVAPGADRVPDPAFVTRRGIAYRDAEPGRFDLDRLRARREAYARLLEEDAVPRATTAASEETSPRTHALAAIDAIREQVTPLLEALARDRDGNIAANLRPRPEDYALAFRPDVADAARKAYEAVWATPPRVASTQAGSRLEVHAAPAGMLASDNELSWHFPGGYRAIAPLLNPHRTWVRWKYVKPGATAGTSYDGLVWLDDRWVWFPKPFRVLGGLRIPQQ